MIVFFKTFFAQDNAGLISKPAVKKFATAFLKSGNINLINDVIKAIHGSGHKIDQVSSCGCKLTVPEILNELLLLTQSASKFQMVNIHPYNMNRTCLVVSIPS